MGFGFCGNFVLSIRCSDNSFLKNLYFWSSYYNRTTETLEKKRLYVGIVLCSMYLGSLEYNGERIICFKNSIGVWIVVYLSYGRKCLCKDILAKILVLN